MMSDRPLVFFLGALLLLAQVSIMAEETAKKTPVPPLATYSGSVADEARMTGVTPLMTDMPALRTVWKSWAIAGTPPEVNFAQELVIISTTRGSILRQEFVRDDTGDLTVIATSTRDLQPGFRYVISRVARAGIVSVNGQPLPKTRRIEPVKLATGSVADEKLLGMPPGFITDAEALAALLARWQLADPLPQVDFTKQLVVISTTRGSVMNISYSLSDTGDLAALGMMTMDLRPGFRYALAVISREGVKQVNGKPLPGEKQPAEATDK